jgi:DNA-binding cell septation regulator SpoVG
MSIKIKSFKKIDDNPILKAFADIEVDGNILIKGAKLMSFKGVMVGKLPDTKGKDNKWYPIVIFNDETMNKELTTLLVAEYKK